MIEEPTIVGTVLGKVLTGIVGVGAGGYALWRMLRSDNTGDKVDQKTQNLISNLEEQLKLQFEENQRQLGENRHLNEVIERLASERNEAVQLVGELKATVTILGERITEVTEEVISLEKENKELRADLEDMAAKISQLSGEIVKLVQAQTELVLSLQNQK